MITSLLHYNATLDTPALEYHGLMHALVIGSYGSTPHLPILASGHDTESLQSNSDPGIYFLIAILMPSSSFHVSLKSGCF